jgi:hypothetical protein
MIIDRFGKVFYENETSDLMGDKHIACKIITE